MIGVLTHRLPGRTPDDAVDSAPNSTSGPVDRGMSEERLAEIEAIAFPDTGLWVVGDERKTTQDVVTALIAEVRRLRDPGLPAGPPLTAADFNAMAERHGHPMRVHAAEKITVEHRRLWWEWTR